MSSSRIFRSRETHKGIQTDIAYEEKRAASRRPLAVNARLHKEGEACLSARTVDLSSTGICLLVAQSLPFNEPWTIEFEMYVEGKPQAIQVLAEVQQMIVSSDGVRIGFQFKRLNMSSMIAISRYVGTPPLSNA